VPFFCPPHSYFSFFLFPSLFPSYSHSQFSSRTPFYEKQRQSGGGGEDPGSAELEARNKMYCNIQEYRDDLSFPPLPVPLGVISAAGSTSTSSVSTSSTSFSTRRSSAVTVNANGSKSPARMTSVKAQETTQLSSGAQEVVSSLLRRDPTSRITADAILHSSWMVS
jgi:hypothetical protein